jgi:hypothetical protein
VEREREREEKMKEEMERLVKLLLYLISWSKRTNTDA